MRAVQLASMILAVAACPVLGKEEQIQAQISSNGMVTQSSEKKLGLKEVFHAESGWRQLQTKSSKAPSVKSTKAPSVKSSKAPSVKSSKAPSVKSSKAPSVKSSNSRREMLVFEHDIDEKTSELGGREWMDDILESGGRRRIQESSSESSKAPSVKSSKAPSVKSSKAPSVKSSKAPSVKSSKAPSVKSSKAPSVKSSKAPSIKSRNLLVFEHDIE